MLKEYNDQRDNIKKILLDSFLIFKEKRDNAIKNELIKGIVQKTTTSPSFNIRLKIFLICFLKQSNTQISQKTTLSILIKLSLNIINYIFLTLIISTKLLKPSYHQNFLTKPSTRSNRKLNQAPQWNQAKKKKQMLWLINR